MKDSSSASMFTLIAYKPAKESEDLIAAYSREAQFYCLWRQKILKHERRSTFVFKRHGAHIIRRSYLHREKYSVFWHDCFT